MAAELTQKELDIQLMLAANVHLGTKNCDFQMERYVYKRRPDGIHVINLAKTYEKLLLAARVIVAIENPQDIYVQSARPYGQRAVLKFAQYTGAVAIAGRHTPGTFTNQLQTSFAEPRLLVLTDPRVDHQPASEAALSNIPVIAFCDTDSPLKHVDIAIPANNKGKHSIGVLYWLLGRLVLQMRGTVSAASPWDVMVDLFFYREPEETKEKDGEEALGETFATQEFTPALTAADGQWEAGAASADWDGAVAPPAQDWAAQGIPSAPVGGWEAAAAPVPAPVAPGWDGAVAAPGWEAEAQ